MSHGGQGELIFCNTSTGFRLDLSPATVPGGSFRYSVRGRGRKWIHLAVIFNLLGHRGGLNQQSTDRRKGFSHSKVERAIKAGTEGVLLFCLGEGQVGGLHEIH